MPFWQELMVNGNPPGVLRIWWVLCAILVFLMQVGFMLAETGFVQERSRSGIAIKTFLMLLASSLAYSVVGYPLMYGPDRWHGWFGFGAPVDSLGAEWQFYQTGFAAVAATIISGAIAERTTLKINVLSAFIIGGVIYPIVGHWVWAKDGWLYKDHFYDFAGAGTVHFLGGIASLAGAWVAGPRRDKFDSKSGRVIEIVGVRSLPLTSAGVILLWIGWMGFNGGSIQDIKGFYGSGTIIISTCCAASAGGLFVLVLSPLLEFVHHFLKQRTVTSGYPVRQFRKRWNLALKLVRNGGVTRPYDVLAATMGGLVAITASSNLMANSFGLWGMPCYLLAILVGMLGGASVLAVSRFLRQPQIFHFTKIDDPVDAIAVHAGAGLTGVLVVAFFRSSQHPSSFFTQFKGLAAIGAFTFVAVWLFFFLLNGRSKEGRGVTVGKSNGKASADDFGLVNRWSPLSWVRSTKREESLGLVFEQGPHNKVHNFLRTPYLSVEVNQKLDESIQTFVSAPIHNFKISISKILSSDKFKSDDLCQEAKASFFQELENMKDFAALQISSYPVDLTEIIRKVCAAVTIDFCLPPNYIHDRSVPKTSDSTALVHGQSDALELVVKSVFSNACFAILRKLQENTYGYRPEIWFRLSSDGHRVSLFIGNNGGAIPEEIATQLFNDVFVRGENEGGAGLGLYAAARLVNNFNGQLGIHENKHNEVCFRIDLHAFKQED